MLAVLIKPCFATFTAGHSQRDHYVRSSFACEGCKHRPAAVRNGACLTRRPHGARHGPRSNTECDRAQGSRWRGVTSEAFQGTKAAVRACMHTTSGLKQNRGPEDVLYVVFCFIPCRHM